MYICDGSNKKKTIEMKQFENAYVNNRNEKDKSQSI